MSVTRLFIVGVAFALSCGALQASAATIDFSTLTGANGSTFTTYTEDGFTVSVATGIYMVDQSFGDPVPSISTSDGTVEIQATGGGPFTFTGVDLGNASTTTVDYFITGYDGGTLIFGVAGPLTNSDGTFALYGAGFSSDTITELSIYLDATSGQGNIDNIGVDAVAATPEPDSLLLLGSGMIGLVGLLRRRLRA